MAAKVLAGALDPVAAEVAVEGLAGELHSVAAGGLAGTLDPVAAEVAAEGLAKALHPPKSHRDRCDIDSCQVSPKPMWGTRGLSYRNKARTCPVPEHRSQLLLPHAQS